MLFFDDLQSNVRLARGLGIAAAHVPQEGMCRALLQRGLGGFDDRRRSQAFLGRWLAGPASRGDAPPPPAESSERAAGGGGGAPPDDGDGATSKRRRL